MLKLWRIRFWDNFELALLITPFDKNEKGMIHADFEKEKKNVIAIYRNFINIKLNFCNFCPCHHKYKITEMAYVYYYWQYNLFWVFFRLEILLFLYLNFIVCLKMREKVGLLKSVSSMLQLKKNNNLERDFIWHQ